MKKTHYRLLEQYTELEMRCHELEGENHAQIGRMNSMSSRGGQSSMTDIKEEPYDYINRPPRAPATNSRYTRTIATDQPDQHDYYNEYNVPTSNNSPLTYNYPARPVRQSALPTHYGKEPLTPTDLSAAYESSLNAAFQSPSKPETVVSSSKSSWSVETSSSSERKKAKVVPKSDVRVYGRGE
jgi:hypothetical protein